MARLLSRPDPSGERCPFCNALDTMRTNKSYAVSVGIDKWRNADNIECENCKHGFWVGWESPLPDGVWPNPIGYE